MGRGGDGGLALKLQVGAAPDLIRGLLEHNAPDQVRGCVAIDALVRDMGRMEEARRRYGEGRG